MSAPSTLRHAARRIVLAGAVLGLVLGASSVGASSIGPTSIGPSATSASDTSASSTGTSSPAPPTDPPPPPGERVVLDSGRSYALHVPPQLAEQPEATTGRPVMVVLHALLTGPADAATSTGFNALADRDGRLVAYPYGIKRSFNAGLCCGEAVVHEVDDVTFLADVVDDLRRRGAGRVSVVGFSNGGMMAYRFACARPDRVDTVGVLSGTLEVPRCAGPIRALHLHGDRDTAVPFDGASFSDRLSAYLRPVPEIAPAAPGSDITVRELEGYPHRWTVPGDAVDATAEFWSFARMAEPT